jgi:hypothetical protein
MPSTEIGLVNRSKIAKFKYRCHNCHISEATLSRKSKNEKEI